MTLNLRPEERLLCQLCKIVPVRVITRGERSFDIRIEGIFRLDDMSDPIRIEAWLPLMAIRHLTPWNKPSVAGMTDYPFMAMDSDWSGVRDTSPEKLWAIFDAFVVPRVNVTGVFKS